MSQSAGVCVPGADHIVQFEIDGPARMIGIENGNYRSDDNPQDLEHRAYNGRGLAIVQSMRGGRGDVTIKATAEGLDPASTPVNDVMTTTMICSTPDETWQQAGSKMLEKGIRHLVVADGDQLVGVISLRDLRTHEIDQKSQEIEYLNDYLYYVPPLM